MIEVVVTDSKTLVHESSCPDQLQDVWQDCLPTPGIVFELLMIPVMVEETDDDLIGCHEATDHPPGTRLSSEDQGE